MKKWLLSLILIIIFSTASLAQVPFEDSLHLLIEKTSDEVEQAHLLVDLAYHFHHKDILKTKSYAEEALKIAKKAGSEHEKSRSFYGIGLYYEQVGDLETALDFYFKSYDIYKKRKDKKGLAPMSLAIGVLFKIQKANQKAIQYYEESLGYYQELEDYQSMGSAYNNLANVYAELKDNKKALDFYEKAISAYKKSNSTGQSAHIYNNIGLVYEEEEEYKKAQNYYEQSHDMAQKVKNEYDVMIANINLGYLHTKKKEAEIALDYLNNGLETSTALKDLQWMMTSYEGLMKLEEQQGNFQQAYLYSKELQNLTDTLFSTKQERIIHRMEEQFDAKNKEQTIQLLENKLTIERQSRIILFVIIGIVFLLGSLLWWVMRFKLKKEQELAQHQDKLHQLKVEKMQADIKFKNNELTTLALQVVQKNDFIEHVEHQIARLKVKDKASFEKDKRSLIVELRQNQLIGQDLKIFEQKIEEIYHTFLFQLAEKYPNMTSKETKIAVLLRIGLSTKEMAIVNNVTEQAIKMSRYRLRKKLGLSSDVHLPTFFAQIT